MCFCRFTSDSAFSDRLGSLTFAIKGVFTPQKWANSRNQSPPRPPPPDFPWGSNIHQHTTLVRQGWSGQRTSPTSCGVCVCVCVWWGGQHRNIIAFLFVKAQHRSWPWCSMSEEGRERENYLLNWALSIFLRSASPTSTVPLSWPFSRWPNSAHCVVCEALNANNSSSFPAEGHPGKDFE